MYNIKTGNNTVLRGLIAEYYARYELIKRFPLLVLRPAKVLSNLTEKTVQGPHYSFLEKYQQTMDFIGFGPVNVLTIGDQPIPEDIIFSFFYHQDGLSKFLFDSLKHQIKGYIIEVKSRTTENPWKPFNYSFSPNQEKMFEKANRFRFDVILCGVTFGQNWEISVVFTDLKGKIISPDFFTLNQ